MVGDIWKMKINEIPSLGTASIEEKLELIDEIWASIPPDEIEPLPAHLAVLQTRLESYESNPDQALSPDEARTRLRELTGL